MPSRRILGIIAALMLALGAGFAANAQTEDRPNFIVILVDDAAYMDFGIYGGEARTPTIDALAQSGAMFTNYHTSPLCAPTRAMLLTGLDNHLTGVSTIPEVLPPEHEGQPGYTLSFEPGVRTVASRLRDAGYRTYMTGKWHLGHDEGELPVDHGFDRSFILDASGADNWEDQTYIPYYARADWFEDGERAELPEDFYSSEFIVDQMIEYLGEDSGSDEPFLAYLAFQAIHIPVQAPREFTENYVDRYTEGWNVLRGERWQRAQELGLIPEGAPVAPMPDDVRAWASLSADDQAIYARNMAINAGMLEAMDHHIARLIDYLDETGELDNTFIFVTSDNGPEPNHPVGMNGFGMFMWLNDYQWTADMWGEEGDFGFIGTEWAIAAASPFQLFKFYATEGGLRVPFIVSGPAVAGQRNSNFAIVSDITPTILDYAGVDPTPLDLTGRSLRDVLEGRSDAAYGPDDPIGMEVSGNAALYRGDWKIARNLPQWGDGAWRLFNLANDPGETMDLSDEYPDLFASMLADYEAYAESVGVLEVPEGFDATFQVRTNTMAKVHARYMWIYITVVVVALLLLGVIGRGIWVLVWR